MATEEVKANRWLVTSHSGTKCSSFFPIGVKTQHLAALNNYTALTGEDNAER